VIAIAEPREYPRENYGKLLGISEGLRFKDWKELLQKEKLADAAIITTQDQMHVEPAVACANKGYHVLLEKPMAVSLEGCRLITDAVLKNRVFFAVGHVMRYTAYSQKVKEIVDSGELGKLVNIQHLEPIGFWHTAHSYVRGNWRNEASSSFILMAKSCHDIDWIRWIVGSKCKLVSSFGSLLHFKKSEKPEGATDRCMSCPVESKCPYSAKKIYLEPVKKGVKGWPVNVLADIPDIESITEALEKGPYGRCVYECDNDVLDNQVVNMIFENGSTASFSMIGFSKEICVRKTRIFGTRGQLECDGSRIEHFDFLTQKTHTYTPSYNLNTKMQGHGSGDYLFAKSFFDAVASKDGAKILSGPSETLESHGIVFAAEYARKTNLVVDVESFLLNHKE